MANLPQRAAGDKALSPIRFSCTVCGRKLKVKASAAGKRIDCPECAEPLWVPSAEREMGSRGDGEQEASAFQPIDEAPPLTTWPTNERPELEVVCPACFGAVSPDAEVCRHCRQSFIGSGPVAGAFASFFVLGLGQVIQRRYHEAFVLWLAAFWIGIIAGIGSGVPLIGWFLSLAGALLSLPFYLLLWVHGIVDAAKHQPDRPVGIQRSRKEPS